MPRRRQITRIPAISSFQSVRFALAMPNLAHTYLWEKRGLEFDNFVGFDIYSQNSTTKYTSGTMFHWDGMVIQYLSKRVGFGVIGYNLTQITNDRGPVANVLHGFEGRALMGEKDLRLSFDGK